MCEHKKIYSGVHLVKVPREWAWICKRCGETGMEPLNESPHRNIKQYQKTLRKFQDAPASEPSDELAVKSSKKPRHARQQFYDQQPRWEEADVETDFE